MPIITVVVIAVLLRVFDVIGTAYAIGLAIAGIAAIFVFVAMKAASSEDGSLGEQEHGAVPVRARLKLSYEDADGSITEREVSVQKYFPEGYIEGRCHLRKSNRTFRLDRIKEAIDLETGEMLPVSHMKSWLRKHKV